MENDNKSFWQRFAKLYSPIMEKSSSRLYRDICDRIRPKLNREMQARISIAYVECMRK